MEFIDLYCERTQLGFWNEPLNILSNLAFFIASLSLFYRIRTFQKVSKFYLFFSALIAVIGFGSIMFHAHPVPLTLWADVLPIFSFILFYLFWANQKWTSLSLKGNLLSLLLILALSLSLEFSFLSEYFKGSLTYAPAYLALLIFAFKSYPLNSQPVRQGFQKALVLFTFSLILRSVDDSLCPWFPIGTHYFWHLLNAYLLYQLCLIVDHSETYPASDQLIAK